ncbi:MAG: hypothetical protein BWY99_02238 [Synergistetes bacterium ADurb.BinA166]|nr:MAG: hypothetical protein BWY99_02238 [Synergistetes bacterium ADurb.BinA166]
MSSLTIAARVAALEKTALPKEWRRITGEQIEAVMSMLPAGSEIYGSYAKGTAVQDSDVDVKLPEDVGGEDALGRLLVKVMKDLDLYVGALNLSMPCDEHENCSVVATTDEGNLIPPLTEHLKGGVVGDESELPEAVQKMRAVSKANRKKFVEELLDDGHFRLTDTDKEAMQAFADGMDYDEVVETYYS